MRIEAARRFAPVALLIAMCALGSGEANSDSRLPMRVYLHQPDSPNSELVYRLNLDSEFIELQMTRHDDDWWVASVEASRIEFAFRVGQEQIDLGRAQGCYPGDHFDCIEGTEPAQLFRNKSPEVWVKHGLVHTTNPDLNSTGDEFTVLTVNMHSYQEYRTSSVPESELTDRLARERVEAHGPLFDRVAAAINALDPDIVCLQEIAEWSGGVMDNPDTVEFGSTGSNMVHQIRKRLDQQYHYTMDWSHFGFDVWLEGSAILSKHPLTHSGSQFISRPENNGRDFWKSRNIPMAQIELPHLGDALIFSVHAGWWGDKDEPFQEQFKRLTAWAGEVKTPDATIIFCGDFNVPAGTEGYQFMTNGTGYSDQYILANPDGFLDATVGGDIDGWEGSNIGKRIDYILMNDESPLEVIQAQRIFTEKVFGRVSDHSGVYARFGSRTH